MKYRQKYIIGSKFNRWLIVGKSEDCRKVVCKCECGTVKEVFKSHLGAGKSEGCSGCRARESYIRHGMIDTPEYSTWANMKHRCLNPNFKDFHLYGGQGITICEKWMKFQGFFDDMGHRPEGTTIDRIDGSKGYFKENCRWATPREQANNIRVNRIVEYHGARFTMAELARKLCINYGTLESRLSRGQPIDGPIRYSKEWHAQNGTKKSVV